MFDCTILVNQEKLVKIRIKITRTVAKVGAFAEKSTKPKGTALFWEEKLEYSVTRN